MSGRILIVDDVATNRIVLKVRLSGACYEVFQARTASEAFQLARRERPDLVLLEANLPDIDGLEVCRVLREDPDYNAVPVVMMHEANDPATRLAAFQAGAEDFLLKPLDELTLLARVRSILRARNTDEELRLRDQTSRELGFAEAAAGFDGPARIAIIGNDRRTVQLKAALAGNGCRHQISTVPLENALNWRAPRGAGTAGEAATYTGEIAPDVFIIPGDLERPDEGLRLLSELRSRPQTRFAGCIMALREKADQQAVIAFDLGANDVIQGDFDADELCLRIETLVRRKRRSDRLRNAVQDQLRQAALDPLTGLYNRRYALTHLDRIATHAKDAGRPYAVMMLDIDRFKQVNDTFGHAVGDIVLTEVARRLRANMRDVDLVARIGGEEFLIAMPDTDVDQARFAAERLRQIVEEVPVQAGIDGPEVSVTLSIGVSMGDGTTGGAGEMPDRLLRKADKALYECKTGGRNRVRFNLSAA